MDARGFIADEDGSIDPEALSDTIDLVRALLRMVRCDSLTRS